MQQRTAFSTDFRTAATRFALAAACAGLLALGAGWTPAALAQDAQSDVPSFLQEEEGAETGQEESRIPPSNRYDFRTERLRDEVQDCEGYDCVRERNRLISRLNERLEGCGPGECRDLRQELRVERRQLNCVRANLECEDPRAR